MTTEEKYIQTMSDLFIVTSTLTNQERELENNLEALNDLNSLISSFWQSVSKLHGERKINAQNTIKTLMKVYNHVGSTYLDEIKWRKKCARLQGDILDLSRQIDELKAENEKLNKLNEF